MSVVFFFNDTATTEIYTLSLHDALPISGFNSLQLACERPPALKAVCAIYATDDRWTDDVHYRGGALKLVDLVDYNRSEEHTSELQSRQYLVCRLLLEKKKINRFPLPPIT